MARRVVAVTNLAGATVTRPRGTEAYAALNRLLPEGPLDVELDSAEVLSGSFLDELVLRLAETGQTDLVTFVTARAATRAKLARAAALRNATVFVRPSPAAPRGAVAPVRSKIESTPATSKEYVA